MKAVHIGIVCRRGAAATRFYGDLLGLKQANTKTVSAGLAQQLFGIDAELRIANYVGDELHFEIFFSNDLEDSPGRIAHVCLEVAELETLVERARAMNFTVLRVSKGEGWVTFIEDDDGNRFELKQA
jgi:catechol 2,3-dioxygenase-like lactoylglutathione lyase family enzyme